jgi:hypothetical protein
MPKKNCFNNELGDLSTPMKMWLLADNHKREEGGVSCTQVISPLRAFVLQQQNNGGTRSLNSRATTALGTAGHEGIERAISFDEKVKRGIKMEVYMVVDVDGYKLSGKFDCLENGVLTDYKFTSVYKVKEPPLEWEQQLNIYAWMYFKTTGEKVKALRIEAFGKDFRQAKAMYQADYPKEQVKIIGIKMWDFQETELFIKQRIAKMRAVMSGDVPLPKCTKEELWIYEKPYAVMRKGQGKAVKLFANKDDADAHAALLNSQPWVILAKDGKKVLKSYHIEDVALAELAKPRRANSGQKVKKLVFSVIDRPLNPIRCAFCDAREHCTQYQDYTQKTPPKEDI